MIEVMSKHASMCFFAQAYLSLKFALTHLSLVPHDVLLCILAVLYDLIQLLCQLLCIMTQIVPTRHILE